MTIILRATKGDELEHDELDGNFTDLDGRATANAAAAAAAQAAADASSQPGHTHPATDITPAALEVTDLVVTGEMMVADEAFPWKDLIGDVVPKTSGAGSPALSTFRDDIRWFSYSVNEDGDCVFHMPHDWAPGTDIFLHVHWAHNGTAISGSIDVRLHVSYAKGHGQEAFSADIEPHIVVGSLNLTNTPRYMHRVDEIQLSSATPSATQLDTADLEPDGLILVHYDMDAIPAITGGAPNEVFLFALDIHYQSNHIGTLNKVPDFYT